MEDGSSAVYSIDVSDNFGKSGLTGIIIIRWDDASAVVDSFLMSCRVIGRGIEFAVWGPVIKDAMAKGCAAIEAQYIPSAKNMQVSDFYERLGLSLEEGSPGLKRYRVNLPGFVPPAAPWVEVSYGE